MASRISNSIAPRSGDKLHTRCTRALWIDYDFGPDRTVEKITESLRAFPHPPSMIVNSGNGLHFYWFLAELFDLHTPANRLRLENTLKGLADYLGGDRAATDCSRVMRIAGTRNFPNAKKRAAGRIEVDAVLLECEPDRVYSIDDFEAFEAREKALATEKNFTAYAQPDPADRGVLPEWVEATLNTAGCGNDGTAPRTV